MLTCDSCHNVVHGRHELRGHASMHDGGEAERVNGNLTTTTTTCCWGGGVDLLGGQMVGWGGGVSV